MNAQEQGERVRAFAQSNLEQSEAIEVVLGFALLGTVQEAIAGSGAGMFAAGSAAALGASNWSRQSGLVLTNQRLWFVRLKPAWFSTWSPPAELHSWMPVEGLAADIRRGSMSHLLTLYDTGGDGRVISFTVRKSLDGPMMELADNLNRRVAEGASLATVEAPA